MLSAFLRETNAKLPLIQQLHQIQQHLFHTVIDYITPTYAAATSYNRHFRRTTHTTCDAVLYVRGSKSMRKSARHTTRRFVVVRRISTHIISSRLPPLLHFCATWFVRAAHHHHRHLPRLVYCIVNMYEQTLRLHAW